jgi:LexA-binding, inner membrane-associated putative hydrolase
VIGVYRAGCTQFRTRAPLVTPRRITAASAITFGENAMANFTTHIAVGTVVSGTLATLTMAADVIAPDNLVAVTAAGVLGSVLPDIDLKDSRPAQAMFAGLALFLSFVALFTIGYKYSIAEMWGVWLGSLVAVRYGLAALFHRFSYHRGIWHSLLAGLFFWFLTAAVFNHVLGRPDAVAWLGGGFLFIGYLTHLILDEIYSVDVFDTRLKASFGSAFKLIDRKHLGDTAVIAGLTALVFLVTPSANLFVDRLTSGQMWSSLHARLLPTDQKLFGVAIPGHFPWGSSNALAGKPYANSLLTTGSLPEAPAPRTP